MPKRYSLCYAPKALESCLLCPLTPSSLGSLALPPGMLVPGVNSTVIRHRANIVSSIWETLDTGLSTGAATKTIWLRSHFVEGPQN